MGIITHIKLKLYIILKHNLLPLSINIKRKIAIAVNIFVINIVQVHQF